MSVGHDEYWSAEQVAQREAARDAGVNLAFFSGNNMFWKTRWVASTDARATPYGTMVCYKETLENAITDPLQGVWTGTWADPRFSPPDDGGQPENAVTGTMFTINARRTRIARLDEHEDFGRLRRAAILAEHSVANLTGSQSLSVGDHVLGYEADSKTSTTAFVPRV